MSNLNQHMVPSTYLAGERLEHRHVYQLQVGARRVLGAWNADSDRFVYLSPDRRDLTYLRHADHGGNAFPLYDTHTALDPEAVTEQLRGIVRAHRDRELGDETPRPGTATELETILALAEIDGPAAARWRDAYDEEGDSDYAHQMCAILVDWLEEQRLCWRCGLTATKDADDGRHPPECDSCFVQGQAPA